MSFLREHIIKPVRRSSKWRKVRKYHIQSNPVCAICGNTKTLEVHHIVPFHIDPKLELNPENLITLCDHKNRSCHRLIGHMSNWKNVNPFIVEDVQYLNNRIKLVNEYMKKIGKIK